MACESKICEPFEMKINLFLCDDLKSLSMSVFKQYLFILTVIGENGTYGFAVQSDLNEKPEK